MSSRLWDAIEKVNRRKMALWGEQEAGRGGRLSDSRARLALSGTPLTLEEIEEAKVPVVTSLLLTSTRHGYTIAELVEMAWTEGLITGVSLEGEDE